MSLRARILILLAAGLIGTAVLWKHYITNKKPLIAFYFVRGDFPCDSLSLSGGVPLPVNPAIDRDPFFSDADFLAWNVTNHTFVITGHAWRRFEAYYNSYWSPNNPNQKCSIIPFVLTARGTNIYIGAFVSLSSSTICVVPTIMVDTTSTEGKVKEVPFSFSQPLSLLTNSSAGIEIVIQRSGLDDAQFARGPDPRNDKRIVEAVEELFAKRKQTGSAVK